MSEAGILSTQTKALELAREFVLTDTQDADLWRFGRAELPDLPAGSVAIVTILIRHASEDGEADGKKLLEVVRVRDGGSSR